MVFVLCLLIILSLFHYDYLWHFSHIWLVVFTWLSPCDSCCLLRSSSYYWALSLLVLGMFHGCLYCLLIFVLVIKLSSSYCKRYYILLCITILSGLILFTHAFFAAKKRAWWQKVERSELATLKPKLSWLYLINSEYWK